MGARDSIAKVEKMLDGDPDVKEVLRGMVDALKHLAAEINASHGQNRADINANTKAIADLTAAIRKGATFGS